MVRYLFFTDWSGTPSWNDTNNFVISTIIVKEEILSDVLEEIANQITETAEYYDLKEEHIVLSANRILRGEGEFAKLHIDNRLEIMYDCALLIDKLEILIINILFDKRLMMDNKRRYDVDDWIAEWAWKLFLEKITSFLDIASSDDNASGTIVFQDINEHANQRHLKLLDNVKKGKNYIQSKYIEDIVFAKKDAQVILQLSDIVAWTVRRYYRDEIKYGDFEQLAEDCFMHLKSKFAKKPNGDVEGFGVKIFPTIRRDEGHQRPLRKSHETVFSLYLCLEEVYQKIKENG